MYTDLREINNEDKYDLFRLHYLERIDNIIEEACGCLKQGEFLAIITPNADCVINRETRFSKMKTDRISLKKNSLHPLEKILLLPLSLEELVSMPSNSFRILGISYLKSILLNSHTYSLYRCLPIKLLNRLQTLTSALPLLKIKLCNCIMVHLQKQRKIKK